MAARGSAARRGVATPAGLGRASLAASDGRVGARDRLCV